MKYRLICIFLILSKSPPLRDFEELWAFNMIIYAVVFNLAPLYINNAPAYIIYSITKFINM